MCYLCKNKYIIIINNDYFQFCEFMKHIITSLLLLCCVAAGAYECKLFGTTYTYSKTKQDPSSAITYAILTDSNGKEYALAEGRTSGNSAMYFAESVYSGTYPVYGVADDIFSNYNATEIHTGNTMKYIGNNAFMSCSKLTKIVLGNNMQIIGSYAFQDCVSLQDLQINSQLKEIRTSAFAGCASLQYLKLPNSIEVLGAAAFVNAIKIKLIDWDLDPEKISAEKIISNRVFDSRITSTAIVHTKTLKQAEEAKKIFTHVYCEEDKDKLEKTSLELDYYKRLYEMVFLDADKVKTHYKQVADCDINQDGAINSTDVVTIYNRIINGSINKHNGYEYVDMGLPGDNYALWATCNLRALTPECVGDYYAWGENMLLSCLTGRLFGKYGFTKENYMPDATAKELTSGNLPAKVTPVKFYMGGNWRMPTAADMVELQLGCTIKEVTINTVKCLEYTSKFNGNKLYFPMAGKIVGQELVDNKKPYYWSCEALSFGKAAALPFNSFTSEAVDRYIGMPIRAVVSKKDVEQ